jgi:hypothetical protein
MRVLREFVESFDFVRMSPHNELLQGRLPDKSSARVLAEPGKQYALYVFGAGSLELSLDLPQGDYRLQWLSVRDGSLIAEERRSHSGGPAGLATPPLDPDAALRIRRTRD